MNALRLPTVSELVPHDWRMQRFFFLMAARMLECKMGVDELARKTGIRKHTLVDCLHGTEEPSFMEVTTLCDVLEIDTRDIFEWVGRDREEGLFRDGYEKGFNDGANTARLNWDEKGAAHEGVSVSFT